jgi:flagellar protein FlbT
VPLIIDLKKGDKIIINGAVLENAGHNTRLALLNEATLLRGSEVLAEDTAQTPASRAYYALQCAYIFPDQIDEYQKQFNSYLSDYLAACPSAKEIGEQIVVQLNKGNIYKALKTSRDLIMHEQRVLSTFSTEAEEKFGQADVTDETNHITSEE